MRGNSFRNKNSLETFLVGLPEELSLSRVGQTECQTGPEGTFP